jgi:hypothetical protein
MYMSMVVYMWVIWPLFNEYLYARWLVWCIFMSMLMRFTAEVIWTQLIRERKRGRRRFPRLCFLTLNCWKETPPKKRKRKRAIYKSPIYKLVLTRNSLKLYLYISLYHVMTHIWFVFPFSFHIFKLIATTN